MGHVSTHGAGGSQGHEGRDNSLLHLVEKNVDLRKELKDVIDILLEKNGR